MAKTLIETHSSDGSSKKQRNEFTQAQKELIIKTVDEFRKTLTIQAACEAARKKLKLDFAAATYNLWNAVSKRGNDYLKKSQEKKKRAKLHSQNTQYADMGEVLDQPSPRPPGMIYRPDGDGNREPVISAQIGGVNIQGPAEEIVRAIKLWKTSN